MKNKLFTSVAIIIAIVMVLSVFAACSKDDNANTGTSKLETIKSGVLTVGSDTTWPPMEYVEGDKIVGFDVDLTQAIADKIGLKLDYQSTAWDGIVSALVAHKFDMVISSMTITEEKKKEINFSDPYFNTDQAALIKEDSDIDAVEKMNGKTMGVQLATTGEIESKKIKDCSTKSYDDILMAFEDLKAGRIDAVMADSYLVYSYATKNEGFKVGFVINTGEKLGIAFAKESPNLLAAVNGALKTLIDDGTYDSIYEKWFGTKPPKL